MPLWWYKGLKHRDFNLINATYIHWWKNCWCRNKVFTENFEHSNDMVDEMWIKNPVRNSCSCVSAGWEQNWPCSGEKEWWRYQKSFKEEMNHENFDNSVMVYVLNDDDTHVLLHLVKSSCPNSVNPFSTLFSADIQHNCPILFCICRPYFPPWLAFRFSIKKWLHLHFQGKWPLSPSSFEQLSFSLRFILQNEWKC